MRPGCLFSLAWNGHWLIAGFTAGKIPQIAANQLLLKGEPAYRRVLGGAVSCRANLEETMENFKQFFAWQTAGKLKPTVSPRHTLGGAGQALRDMLDRKITGKIVLIS